MSPSLMGRSRINATNHLFCNRGMVDLKTWLASAFEENGWENDKDVDGLNMISLDLEPSKFKCKAFRDFRVQGAQQSRFSGG